MTTHPATLGRFFEDYVVGDVYQHPMGRTITDGKVIVNSGLTIALVLGLSVIDMSQNAVANLQFTDVKLAHPVYVGDTIYAESICTDLRMSQSRPYAGIVSMVTRGINQDGEVVISWRRSVMVATRESGIGQNYFPEVKAPPLTELTAENSAEAAR